MHDLEMHGWDEQYADLLDCYGDRWLEWTAGMTEAETADLAGGLRRTMVYAIWRLRVAMGACGAAWAEVTGIARVWRWVKRRIA